ncbi:MAG: pyridoxal phosphate-dependent aminotransferase [Chloroflexaceae bacterium]|nr:pyridoxal phosphate-dependent aminotransferase [Chloroflexaceae bacterium]
MPTFTDLDLSPNPIELARRRIAATTGYIDLTSSNPTQQGLLFPPAVLERNAARFWHTRRYLPDPHGLPAARAAIAQYYHQRTPPLQTDGDAIYITASTSEAYSLLFALLTDPGDNVLAPNVTYPLFDFLAAIHRIELRSYLLDEAHGWQIDGQSVLDAADARTRAVLIVSPHNPTGAIVAAPVPAFERLDVPLICDEVFAPFTYRATNTPPLATLHPTLPVLTLNGISKMFALPDMKLGWIVLNAPAQAQYGERLELLNDTFLSANSLTQFLLPTLFEEGQPFVAAMVERVRHNIDTVLQRLSACPALQVHPPDGGYYLFPALHEEHDEEALVIRLLEAGVLVHPGFFYGDVPGTHLMISALTDPPQLVTGLERLCGALEDS